MSLNINIANTNHCDSLAQQDNNANQQQQESNLNNEQQTINIVNVNNSQNAEDLNIVSSEQSHVIKIDDSVNNLLSEIVQKNLCTLDKEFNESTHIQVNSTQGSLINREGQDDKENESHNVSNFNTHSPQQSNPPSPCQLSQPSQILKTYQSNSSSSTKTLSKNDENDNQNIKHKIVKNSPSNPLKNVLNNSVYLNKYQIKEQPQTSNGFQNVGASPFKERDQNSILKSNSPLNSTSYSSEKKQQSQSFSTLNVNLVNLVNQSLNNNESLNSKQDILFEQKEDQTKANISEILECSNNSQSSEQEINSQIEYQMKNNESNLNSENNNSHLVENMRLKNQLSCTSHALGHDENLVIKNNEFRQKDNKLNQKFEQNLEINQHIQIIVEEKLEQIIKTVIQASSEKDDQVEVKDNSSILTITNQSQQEKFDDDNSLIEQYLITFKDQTEINHNQEIENQQQLDADQENIQPINLIEPEDENEDEQEENYEINNNNEQKKEEKISDQQIENPQNNSNKENINIEEDNSENLYSELSYEAEEKSETIKHLEGYQNIIKETDNYLDQLVMYMIREKATLTNIQKSIQTKNQRSSSTERQNSQETKYSNQISSTQKSQIESSAQQEDIKQTKQTNDTEDYKYQCKPQREEDTENKILTTVQQKYSQNQSNQNSLKTQSNKNSSQLAQTLQSQQVTKYSHVNEMISISIESIKFGIVFPGNIFEEQVQITNKTNEMVFIKVVGLCLNPEFDSHGEYVYSIRKTINYDYNEKLMFSITPHSSVKVHVALKVPNINVEKILKGSFAVTVNGYDSYISIPITSSVEIPKILCTRQLFHASRSSKVIKLAIRRGKKSDCKIPFKNTYGYSLQLEPFWLTDQTNEQHITNIKDGSKCPFQLNLTPQLITVQPKGLFMINLLLRPNQFFKEYNEKRVLSGDKTPLHIKNILIIKVTNSSLLLHFPVSLEVY